MSLRRDQPPTVATGASRRPRSPAEALEPLRAPPRPRGGKIRRESRALNAVARAVSGFLTFAVVLMIGIGGAAWLLNSLYESPGPLEATRTVVIQKGDGRIAIAEQLEREGVISSRWAMVANHLIRNMLSRDKPLDLKAGEYEFKKGASLRQVLETIAGGRSVLYKVTIPEGLTSQQIVERLRAEESLTGEVAEIPPEGSLLPDTYRVSKGMARQELIERMQVEQKRVVTAAWEKRKPDLPITTPEEAIALASIVEKETGRPDERERVAAVFVNRLKKKMRLQSDPTIIYGIAGGQGTLGRPITRADIDTKTDYNTYRISGLPPGPICNPGRAAIEATLNPAATSDLYFVADGTGGHTFSSTLAAHNAAVKVWRKIEKQKGAEDAAADEARAAEAEKAAAGAGDDTASAAVGTEPEVAAGEPATAVAVTDAAPAAGKEPTTVNASAASSIPLPVRKPRL